MRSISSPEWMTSKNVNRARTRRRKIITQASNPYTVGGQKKQKFEQRSPSLPKISMSTPDGDAK